MFLGASLLLFAVEPMAAKVLIPGAGRVFGGVAGVAVFLSVCAAAGVWVRVPGDGLVEPGGSVAGVGSLRVAGGGVVSLVGGRLRRRVRAIGLGGGDDASGGGDLSAAGGRWWGCRFLLLSATSPLLQVWMARAVWGRCAVPDVCAVERGVAAGAGGVSGGD